MKYREIDGWEIDGDIVKLKKYGMVMDILHIDDLVAEWLQENGDKEIGEG